jgi:uncharacterized protein with HEPN domain
MSRDYRLYLDDIRESCEKVLRYVHGLTFGQFVHDEKIFDAVVRNLEIIGEGAKHIPPDIRSRYPEVEWPKIAGLRDVVVHEYFRSHVLHFTFYALRFTPGGLYVQSLLLRQPGSPRSVH